MNRFRHNTTWVWLLCIALLAVRMGGAHWHLCMDGSEPPRTFHAGHLALGESAEPAGHADTGHTHTDISHADIDLDLVDDAFAKNTAKTLDLPLLFCIAAALFLMAQRQPPLPPHRIPFTPTARYRLIARPRAPPR